MIQRPAAPSERRWTRLRAWLNTETNGASLAFFRIAVGLVMALEAWSLCRPSASFSGKIPLEVFYTGPDVKFHFAYPGFHWLPVLPAHWIEGAVVVLGVAGLMMAAGFCYRLAAALVFVSWGYLYAIESTRTYWMSYHYLELLISFVMIWMPGARRFSIDARLARGKRAPTVPMWTLALLRGQLVISYFFAGVAKLNADWLLDAQPVRYYLSQARWLDDYGKWFSAGQLASLKRILQSADLAYFISYAGAVFDLSVGFLLLFRPTRILGMVLMMIFHGTNHFLIFKDIEWFPLLGVLTATIFFEPDWPERFWAWLRHPRKHGFDWRCLIGRRGAGSPAASADVQRRNPIKAQPQKGPAFRSMPATLLLAWLTIQALIPLRQYLIPGDARFTWEGLSFSWRLKAEVYRSTPCALFLDDAAIFSRDSSGHPRIDWNNWHGEKVLYRRLTPGRVDWAEMPEIFVLLEPMVGERILYNPFAGGGQGRTEAESRARVSSIWQETYGHQPQVVLRTAPSAETLSACAGTLRARGQKVESTREAAQLLESLPAAHEDQELISIMRQTHPLVLEGAPDPAVPFLLVEDPPLAHDPGTARMRTEPTRWVQSSHARNPRDSLTDNVGRRPLVVYVAGTLVQLKDKLPQAAVFDFEQSPAQPPFICWNYLSELTYSEGMHLSLQPFLLREYARHIAGLWQREYGRRPTVRAETAVSLNGRPLQRLVDPTADLASVPLSRFHHNPWIRFLEHRRIPPGASLQ